MANFSESVGNLMFIVILMLGLFAFIIQTQSDNEAADPLVNDPLFNETYENLKTNANDTGATTASQFNSFNSEVPQPGTVSIILFQIVAVGKTFANIVMAFLTIVIKLPVLILGIDPNITNLVIAWIVIGLIVAIWLLYKLGG